MKTFVKDLQAGVFHHISFLTMKGIINEVSYNLNYRIEELRILRERYATKVGIRVVETGLSDDNKT